MRRIFLMCLLCFAPVAGSAQPTDGTEEVRERIRAGDLLDRRPVVAPEEMNRRTEALKSHLLFRRMEAMARAWNDVVVDMSQGLVNLKKVKKVKRAWRELEKTEGWPQ